MSRSARQPDRRPLQRPATGRALLVLVGLGWAVFCLALDAAGHAPSRPPLPVARWYRVQAVLLPVLVPLMGELAGHIAAWRLARHGHARRPVDRQALRLGLALPLGGFVLGDAVGWAVLGFEQLALVSGLLGLLALPAMVGISAAGLHRPGLAWGRRAAVAAVSLGIAGALGSLVLR